MWAAVAGASGALGPVIGGALLEHFSWGSVFLVNVPVIVVALVAGWYVLPSSRDADAPRLDPVGAAPVDRRPDGRPVGDHRGAGQGLGRQPVLDALAAGIVLLVAFVAWELHIDHPMLDVRFFRNRRFSAANVAITLVFFAMFGQMFLGTQYLQTVLGFSALEAGIRMLPMAVFMMIARPARTSARRADRHQGRRRRRPRSWPPSDWASSARCPSPTATRRSSSGFCFVATGMALTMAPATESIMGSLPRRRPASGRR